MPEFSLTDTEERREGFTVDVELCAKRKREGGGEAWLTVVGSLLVYYSSFGIMNSFGFFQDYYSRETLRHRRLPSVAPFRCF
jgi:MCP family monocarboxylic acid transporter-like MFS transporter 10